MVGCCPGRDPQWWEDTPAPSEGQGTHDRRTTAGANPEGGGGGGGKRGTPLPPFRNPVSAPDYYNLRHF